MICTDCTGSCKSNYHTITTTAFTHFTKKRRGLSMQNKLYIYFFSPLFINNIIIDCTSLVHWQLLLKVYFTGNKTVLYSNKLHWLQLYNYVTLSIFPCCYYVHCMFVFHIVNHCNCYAPCGSLINWSIKYSSSSIATFQQHLHTEDTIFQSLWFLSGLPR